jgi:predicted DNA-binding transcriptional regulator AlpA
MHEESTMTGLERLISTRELAEYLGVAPQAIYDLRTAGRGPRAVHVGRELRYRVSEIQRGWIASPIRSAPETEPTMPGRPRTGIGTFGSISTVASGSKAFSASTRVRDWDGQLRRVTARGTTKAKAVAALKAKLANRDQSGAAGETVTADMPLRSLRNCGSRTSRSIPAYPTGRRQSMKASCERWFSRLSSTSHCARSAKRVWNDS